MPLAARAQSSRDVALPSVPAPLAGTLTLPAGEERVPGVLLIAGSGPTDRNGNQPGMVNDAYRKLADGLAACDVATLRTDKRGIALSAAAEPDEANLTVETYVQDTLRWLDWLRAQPRIGNVALIGHSEGALIATLAAQRMSVSRLVLLAGAGRPAGEVLREQLATLALAPVLRRKADQMIALLERGETDDEPPPALAALFRPSVQPYLVSWFRLDPVQELARVTAPTLVVQGTTDVQVPVSDAQRLAGARNGIRLDIVDGMNHVLRSAPADWRANVATYTDASLPLAPALVPTLCAFLRR
ncbi:MAG: alpha/beta fold hydrolase [Acetobacteraceae bacterium]|nr:alpha/beta fold hydrolase [Acetobacteraceae bacterium]